MENSSEEIFQALPLADKRVLHYASCFASGFNETALTALFALEGERTREVLRTAVENGLLAQKSSGKRPYHFPDPALQAHIHGSMDALARADAHFRIGNSILRGKPREKIHEHALEILYHLGQAPDHLQTEREKRQFFRLSLIVAGIHRKNADWAALGEVLEGARQVVPVARKDMPDLWLQGQMDLFQAQSMLGMNGQGEKTFSSAVSAARSPGDKARLYQRKAEVKIALADPVAALQACRQGLKLLDLDFPAAGDRSLLHRTWNKMDGLVQKRSLTQLKTLSFLGAEEMPVIGELLLMALRLLLGRDPVLAAILGLKAMEHHLRNGLHGHSFIGFLAYGIGLAAWNRDFRRAAAMIRMGAEISEKILPGVPECQVARAIAENFAGNLPEGGQQYENARSMLMAQGKQKEALEVALLLLLHRFHSGLPLDRLEEEASAGIDQALALQSAALGELFELMQDQVRLFRGLAPMSSEKVDQDGGSRSAVLQSPLVRACLHVLELQRAVLYDRPVYAARLLEQGQGLAGYAAGMFTGLEYQFWAGMALGPEIPKNRSWWQGGARSLMAGLMAKSEGDVLEAMADASPENFACRRLLVLGRGAARDNPAEALKYFQEARAKAGDHLLLAAIAHEMPGMLLCDLGREKDGLPLVKQAIQLYRKWGSPGRAQSLMARFPHALGADVQNSVPMPKGESSMPLARASGLTALLDISRIFFSDLTPDALCARILEVFSAEFPCSSALLLQVSGNQYLPVLASRRGTAAIKAQVAKKQDFPKEFLNTVVNQGAAISSASQAEPYFSMQKVHSALGFALGDEKEGRRIVYLERAGEEPAFEEKDLEAGKILALLAGMGLSSAQRIEMLRENEDRRSGELEETLDFLRTARDQLVQSEKLASLGQVTAGIAHEIRNPLNFVNNFSELSIEMAGELREELEELRGKTLEQREMELLGEYLQDLEGNLEKIQNHGKRAESIVHNMLMHAASGKEEEKEVDLNRLIREYALLAYHGFRGRLNSFVCRLEFDLDEAVGLGMMQQQDISRALLNIFQNAFQAMEEKSHHAGPEYKPMIQVRTVLKGKQVEITIRDNGPGIPEELRARVFEPFFTTKATGKGTGLGLSLAYELVVQGHGGELKVGSSPGEYTEFLINLPWKR